MSESRVMVDIETLGLEVGCSIISIGAVEFDDTGLGKTFERSINLTSCEAVGLEIDADTLQWWLNQEEAAQEQLTGGMDLSRALIQFNEFYHSVEPEEVWANSPSFDCEHLEHAYDLANIKCPWKYYEERDYRTLTNLVDVEIAWNGVEHDALDDAKYQATMAVEALNQIHE